MRLSGIRPGGDEPGDRGGIVDRHLELGIRHAAGLPISTLMSNAINLSLFGTLVSFTFTPTGY